MFPWLCRPCNLSFETLVALDKHAETECPYTGLKAPIELPGGFECGYCSDKYCCCPERVTDGAWHPFGKPGDSLYRIQQDKAPVDLVNHPPHYKKGGIECIDYLVAKLSGEELKGYLKGNIIKYLSRAADKADGTKELEDYKKAQWYMNRLVEELSKPK